MTRTVTDLGAGTLPDDVDQLKELVLELLRDKEHLEHRLQVLLRQRFGPSAERIDASQLQLFAKELLAESTQEPAPELETTVCEHSRRNGRRKLPADLPRIRVEHDLPDEELACPCCGDQRRKIGEETSEQLEYEPAKVHVIEHVRMKYACKKCEGEVVTAPKARQAIEKCLAGPGLLAQVVVSKYSDHLPLHRLERIFKRHGVELNRSTMCDWMRLSADALMPLADLMKQRILESAVIHTDDTPVPVQDKGRGKTKQGRFWVYVGDTTHKYAVFDYTPDRTRAGPVDWLKGYEGYLQADAYAGYDVLYSTGKISQVSCWAHARRKFYEARLTDPGRCLPAMAWIKRLYEVEREAKKAKLEPDERRELRQEKSVPLLAELKTWLNEQSDQVLPKSAVNEALQYVRSRWASFTRYTESGILSIDNNMSENALRCVALGRKNWLFAGSDRGGKTAAVLFSMIASSKLNAVEPWAWLSDVMRRLPDITVSRLPELLPDQWQASQGSNTSTHAATAPTT
jgi:transposase